MPIDLETIERLVGSDVHDIQSLAGGDVAESFRVELGDGSFLFAKTHANPPPGFFTTEALGLTWLRDVSVVAVPEVIVCSDDPPLLVLQWIDEVGLSQRGTEATGTEEIFGRSLAKLHNAGASCFGREDERTTGSRGLPNQPQKSWAEFYATQRLLPLARLASDSEALSVSTIANIEAIAKRLDELGGPMEPPARLHGDLWAGNRIVDRSSNSWLIDPACHGGHREFDLAMMRLFGGFGPECFEAYAAEAPLSDGWADRISLHQLAPLIVHAIKFGGGYPAAVEEALQRYR